MDIPSWYGWVVLAMVAPGLVILIGVAVAFLVHRPPPVVSTGPRYFHILGFDPKTDERRELNIQAEDPLTARGLAQLQGMIVTDVTPIVAHPASTDQFPSTNGEAERPGNPFG